MSIWVDMHDTREQYESILAATGIRRAGYLVTESLYRDYGDNRARAATRLADGQRSPGIVALSVFRTAGRHERRDLLRPLVRVPVTDVGVDAAPNVLRPQRRRARADPGAPRRTGRSSRRRGRRPRRSPTSTSSSATDNEDLGERIRIMLDSTKRLFDVSTMRNYTLSEYLNSDPTNPEPA